MSKSRLKILKPGIITVSTSRGGPIAVERIRGHRLTKIRRRIGLRDGYVCQLCGRVTAHGEVDHRVPLALGGSESDANLENIKQINEKEHKEDKD